MNTPFDTAWESLRKTTLGVSKPQGWEKLDRRYEHSPGRMRNDRKKRLDDFQGRVNDTPLDRGEHDIMEPTVFDRYDDNDIEWGEVYDETGYPTGEIDYGAPESLRALSALRYFRQQHPTRSPGTGNDFGKYPFWIGHGTHPDGGEMSFDEEGEPNKWSFDGVHSGQPRRLGHHANRVDEE